MAIFFFLWIHFFIFFYFFSLFLSSSLSIYLCPSSFLFPHFSLVSLGLWGYREWWCPSPAFPSHHHLTSPLHHLTTTPIPLSLSDVPSHHASLLPFLPRHCWSLLPFGVCSTLWTFQDMSLDLSLWFMFGHNFRWLLIVVIVVKISYLWYTVCAQLWMVYELRGVEIPVWYCIILAISMNLSVLCAANLIKSSLLLSLSLLLLLLLLLLESLPYTALFA